MSDLICDVNFVTGEAATCNIK